MTSSRYLSESIVVELRMLRYSGVKVAQIVDHIELNYRVKLSKPTVYRICRGTLYQSFGGPRVTASRKRFIRKLNAAA